MRWFMYQRYAVEITNSLNVWKNAGADHERQHVYGNEECRAYWESNQHSYGDFCVSIKLNLYHRHLWI